jgi:hypothetical protein
VPVRNLFSIKVAVYCKNGLSYTAIMPTKTIKIFIASSAELKADREEFRIFISV